MKCRQTMLHVECRTINHFFRLDKRIKIEITSYSYNFEIVVYSFFDKNIFSFSIKAFQLGLLKLKHFSFFLHGFKLQYIQGWITKYPIAPAPDVAAQLVFNTVSQVRGKSQIEHLKIKRSERSFLIPFPFTGSNLGVKN